MTERAGRGASTVEVTVTLEELDRDPYPVFRRLREQAPVCWIQALGMWYVLGYEDVRAALLDTEHFTTEFDHSTILDTFGPQMLTSEGVQHDRYRKATQYAFTLSYVRQHYQTGVTSAAVRLIDSFRDAREADLRTAFAARLPVQTILAVCGFPLALEPQMRIWFDSFERALANFTGDTETRDAAKKHVTEFHATMAESIEAARGTAQSSVLAKLVNAPGSERLSDEEIRRNLSIICFGGISTVEALILNAMWALFEHPNVLKRVRDDYRLLPSVLEETMRWMSPVQSATRHVKEDMQWRGVTLRKNDVLNCMLGAANRDPRIFDDPDTFNVDRDNLRRHLGFAAGSHACLGFNLAKLEAGIAIEQLLRQLPSLTLDRNASAPPTGYEFRQSRRLIVNWHPT